MNKTTKGGIAAGAAAVLLLGGASTLAFWTDSDTVNGGAASSGFLTLKAQNITGTQSPCEANWKYQGTQTVVKNFVPGDQITKKCTFVVGAEGENLQASPTVPASVPITTAPQAGATPAGGNAASFRATVAAAYDLNGTTFSPSSFITEADNGKTLTATLTVTFPFGTNELGVNPAGVAGAKVNTNDTQNITATLNALTVSLTQNQTAANPN